MAVDAPAAQPAGGAGSSSLDRAEIVIAILLGIAAIMTAYAAFQSSQLGGTVTAAYSEGIRLAAQSAQKHNQQMTIDAADESVFLEYVKATHERQPEMAEYVHRSLMSPELAAAVDWWLAQPDSKHYVSPFVPDDPHWSPALEREATALAAQSEASFAEAKANDALGADFDILSIIIAIALFLFGVASLVRQQRIKIGFGVVGAVILVYSGIRLIELGNPAGVSIGMLF